MSDLRSWVWLSAIRGLRPIVYTRLLNYFGSIRDIYLADKEQYSHAAGISARECKLLTEKDLSEADKTIEFCKAESIDIITMADDRYPEPLRQIADPPAVLYVRGRIPDLSHSPAIAMVGTRNASDYGRRAAERLASEVCSCGGIIVTGMALGIDAAAAKGALRAKGICIGVMGTGINKYYPPQNKELIRDVAVSGAIISEFPPDFPVFRENFPRRNRIISGLCCGTCVVEAPEKSGALITANFSLEQGRDLFAVPGNIDSESSRGTNRLIQICAKPVTAGWDIVGEYEALYPGAITRYDPGKLSQKELPADEQAEKSDVDKGAPISYSDLESRISGYSDIQKKILMALADQNKHVDTIISETGISTARALAELTVLSIRGAVRSMPGKFFSFNLK